MDDQASPMLKLARALEHYTEFNEKLTTFREANPFTFYYERDPYSSFQIHKVKVIGRPQPDPRLGTVVGDFASNLRAAPDHLVWAMSVSPKVPEKVAFPIDEHAVKLPATFKRKHVLQIGAIPDEAQDLIEGLQPYKRYGSVLEDPLWRIRCLANTDKHRTVSVVASGIQYHFGSALFGSSRMFIPFDANPQVDPVIPDDRRQFAQPWYHTCGQSSSRATFAVITTEGLHVPVEHLIGLYEFVKTAVFPLFPRPERLFPVI